MEVSIAASSAPSTPHPPSELFIKWCETQATANFILTFPADLPYSSFTSVCLTDCSSLPPAPVGQTLIHQITSFKMDGAFFFFLHSLRTVVV